MTNRKLSKTLRRLLGVLVCVALVLLTVPAVSLPVSAATSGKTEGGTWRLQGDTLIFSGKGSMSPLSWSHLNEWGKAKQVPPWRTFKETVTKVIIEDGVTDILSSSFKYFTELTDVTIPGSVKVIGESAFSCNDSLENLTLKEGITTIGQESFHGCESLATVNIPGSVKTLGTQAFSWCTSLSKVSLSEGVSTIGDMAFSNCNQLASIDIPSSVTTIGEEAFAYCYSLNTLSLANGIQSIGKGAFDYCKRIASVNLPETVKRIGPFAFSCCNSLEKLTVDTGNPVYHSEGNCIIHTENALLVLGCQNSVIPNDGSVTAIGDYAFFGQNNLSAITIPKAVKSIGNYAFSGTGLSSATLPVGAKTIGKKAFADCTFLTSITIPDTVTSIATNAFEGCSDITIRGKFGSYAESYAKKNGFTFVEAKFADYAWVWYVLIAVGGIVLVAAGVFVGLLLGKRKKPAIATETAPVTEPTAVEPTASQK